MSSDPERQKSEPRQTYVARFESIPVEPETTRASRLARAQERNSAVRSDLEAWIDENDLTDHVRILPVGRIFNLLFLEADSVASNMLPHAPHLIEVAPCEETEVELLGVY